MHNMKPRTLGPTVSWGGNWLGADTVLSFFFFWLSLPAVWSLIHSSIQLAELTGTHPDKFAQKLMVSENLSIDTEVLLWTFRVRWSSTVARARIFFELYLAKAEDDIHTYERHHSFLYSILYWNPLAFSPCRQFQFEWRCSHSFCAHLFPLATLSRKRTSQHQPKSLLYDAQAGECPRSCSVAAELGGGSFLENSGEEPPSSEERGEFLFVVSVVVMISSFLMPGQRVLQRAIQSFTKDQCAPNLHWHLDFINLPYGSLPCMACKSPFFFKKKTQV